MLEQGQLHWFADWPTGDLPKTGAIVYTVWDRDGQFLYVGMTRSDARGRLGSHASGRRSGDQFCVYIADRIVMPLVANRIAEIAEGTLSLDAEIRRYVRDQLGFRWVLTAGPREALNVERAIQGGGLAQGKPLLNPR